MIAFGDLARAAYCPRQLYYVRRDATSAEPPAHDADVEGDDHPRRPSAEARERIALAYRYPELLDASDAVLEALPIGIDPASYRAALDRLRDRDPWDRLVAPARTRAFLAGRDCHGIAYKVLPPPEDGSPPVPTIVSPGEPPESGVWEPQGVRAVAVAKALAWEREREIPRALVEYPAFGVVREVRLTVRRTAAYRRTLRAVRAIDGPPPRVADSSKCEPCEYRDRCGTRTRSLASRLGF